MAGGQLNGKAWKENYRPQRMTAAEFNTMQAVPAPKANKYGAVPVNDPEHGYFHSTREHQHFHVLRMRERAGEITGLKRQVPYQLNVNGEHVCEYKADFTYTQLKPSRGFVVEDVKGCRTPEFALKAKLFKAIFGFEITEVR